eukprot:gene2519-46037_t
MPGPAGDRRVPYWESRRDGGGVMGCAERAVADAAR